MGFDEYQERANATDLSRETRGVVMRGRNLMVAGFLEKVLGLAGEAGEASDKIKKILRDEGGKITDTDRTEIAKELGDVLWYVANIALYLDVPLSEVAEMNLAKLASRKKRGKLHGSGDNR